VGKRVPLSTSKAVDWLFGSIPVELLGKSTLLIWAIGACYIDTKIGLHDVESVTMESGKGCKTEHRVARCSVYHTRERLAKWLCKRHLRPVKEGRI